MSAPLPGYRNVMRPHKMCDSSRPARSAETRERPAGAGGYSGLCREASENTPTCTQPSEQGKSAQPLDQRQLDLRLLAQRGREATLGCVADGYYMRVYWAQHWDKRHLFLDTRFLNTRTDRGQGNSRISYLRSQGTRNGTPRRYRSKGSPYATRSRRSSCSDPKTT